MLEGIKLLIERMDSNPEEFFGDLSYRWATIMQDIAKHGQEFLSEEDLIALNQKVKEVRRKELNAKIVDEIATSKRLKEAQDRFEQDFAISEKATRIAGKPSASTGTFSMAQVKSSGSPVSFWMDKDAFDNTRF